MAVGEPDENQTRCAACGSLLYSVVRAPWYEGTDDLSQNEEF